MPLFTQLMTPQAQLQLRTNMRKVAAVMAKADGVPLSTDEVTLKEAGYIMGFRFWKHYLEKRAMLDGIVNTMRLR